MTRTVATLIAGLALGTVAGYFLFAGGNGTQVEVVRDIVDAPKMAAVVAEQHRENRYEDLKTIEDIYELPSAFARSEALYALAGRSDSAALQGHIFNANRIADTVDRQAALSTLFFRLAEVDPRSALQLARTDALKSDKTLEYVVWRTWAQLDLDDALVVANAQTNRSYRNSAAQALFSVFDFMGNATTDRIEAELGIGPDRATRSRFLYRMADRSPREAIEYINSMAGGTNQGEFAAWLAYYLTLSGTTAALQYADLFDNKNLAARYRAIVSGNAARENPRTTVERLLATGKSGRRSSEFRYAVTALAESDLEAAMQYFEQSRSAEDKEILGSAVADQLARTDPSQALAWARANDKRGYPTLEMAVLSRIAQTDPQFAVAEAEGMENAEHRRDLVNSVIAQMARTDPRAALPYLEQITNREHREQAEYQLASTWLREDPDAAVDWILSEGKEARERLLENASWSFMRTDIETAIRLLPKLSDQQQRNWRQQIAQLLVERRSIADAQEFVMRFEGQDGYETLQASLITGVAQQDPLRAKQLADELIDSDARDSAYAAIIGQRANTNPLEAVSWLQNISEDHQRSMATMMLVRNWSANEPKGALRWVKSLQTGTMRDDAIMHMAGQWKTPTPEQEAMVDSISDPEKRGQAIVQQIYSVMRTNPSRAKEMLEEADIPNYQRQQIEAYLNRHGRR